MKKLSSFKQQQKVISQILKELDYYISYDFNSEKEESTISVSFTKKEYKISYNRELGLIYCPFLEMPIHCPDIRMVPGSIYLILVKICEFNKYPVHRVLYTVNKKKRVEELFFQTPEAQDIEVAAAMEDFLEFAIETHRYGLPNDVLVQQNKDQIVYILENFYDIKFTEQ